MNQTELETLLNLANKINNNETIKHKIQNYIYENYVNRFGDLTVEHLDFSLFKPDCFVYNFLIVYDTGWNEGWANYYPDGSIELVLREFVGVRR